MLRLKTAVFLQKPMQPTAYPVPHKLLTEIWQTFTVSGYIPATEGYEPDPVVVQSWQRCAPRLDPNRLPRPRTLSSTSLASMMMAHADVMSVAIPYIEDMNQFIEGSGSAILLTDGGGCMLTTTGDAAMQQMIQEYGLVQGSYWTEDYLGTNAVGVAMQTAMPVQVVGAEHYNRVLHNLTTTAAPIHDANGRIVGIVTIVCEVETATSHTLSLVMAIARAISNQLQANLFLEEANLRLTELNTILETIAEGVIAWNANGRITNVNTQAGELLHLSPTAVVGQPLSTLDLPADLMAAFSNNSLLHEVEMSVPISGGEETVAMLVNLTTLGRPGQGEIGWVAMLRPIEQVRRMVHRQVGAQATLKLEDVFAVAQTMRPVMRQAQVAARGTAPVLLRGEGGVGKNHLARAIHNASTRANQPFLSINCRALPRELIVSEFLGYEKSGQQEGRPSKFELAYGGTLFLDRIESMSLEMQAALLQVIETGTVMRLGSSRPLPVDVRIIAATSANLEDAVADGAFISHLYYRFGVFNIHIPPLRERQEDIPQLAQRFLARVKRSDAAYELDESCLEVLRRYPWPGNVRELEMVLERALHMSQSDVIRVVDLPEVVRSGRVVTAKSPKPAPVLSAAEAEREAIIRAGWACQGKVTAMSEQLGIGRTTLWRKMKQMNISAEYFKNGHAL